MQGAVVFLGSIASGGNVGQISYSTGNIMNAALDRASDGEDQARGEERSFGDLIK